MTGDFLRVESPALAEILGTTVAFGNYVNQWPEEVRAQVTMDIVTQDDARPVAGFDLLMTAAAPGEKHTNEYMCTNDLKLDV